MGGGAEKYGDSGSVRGMVGKKKEAKGKWGGPGRRVLGGKAGEGRNKRKEEGERGEGKGPWKVCGALKGW